MQKSSPKKKVKHPQQQKLPRKESKMKPKPVSDDATRPIWTPLIPPSFDADKIAKHGSDLPMKRPGEPVEVAPCYLFLASDDGSYMTVQVLHPNGGEIVNG